MSEQTIPGPKGAQNVRWSGRLGRDIYGTLPKIREAFGDVVDLGIRPYRAIYLFGPDASQALFAQGAGTVSWHDAMAPLIPVDGDTAIVVSDGADHERRRRIVQPAFGRRKLDDTIALMHEEASVTFAAWSSGTDHEAYSELRLCVRRIVMRALFGDDMGERADEFGDRLEDALTYINRPPWRRFDHEWPGTPYRKAMRSRRSADAIVYEEIARRRALSSLDDRVDLLSVLLAAHDDDALSDVEIRDQVVSLIAAGYDTTTAAAAWMVHFLATNPNAMRLLDEEVQHQIGDALPTAAHFQQMPWLNGVVSETLRLGAPGFIAGRRIDAPFEVLGHILPAGPFAFYVPYVTHRIPELWPEPNAFLPGRWVEGHKDAHQIVAGSWIPFGGGARRCLGLGFATTELKVLAVELARAVADRMQPQRRDIGPTGLASMAPDGGVHVHID